jgi:hypothetical protein
LLIVALRNEQEIVRAELTDDNEEVARIVLEMIGNGVLGDQTVTVSQAE